MPQGPIFIIGAMGSGTTLLRLMLDSHPNIAIPAETGFMRAYNAHRFIPFKWSGRRWAKRLGWSRKELDRELASFYEHLFMRYVERHGKRRWGEKTPLHTFHVDDMARLYPDSVFVGMVRHPGGEVASTMRRFGHPLDRATYHYLRYTREVVRQAARHGDRFAVLRYEDLVRQPERTLRDLLAWLGEPWSDQVLAHATVQRARGGKRRAEGGSRVDEPVDASRVERWTRTLSASQRRKVARRLGGLGDFLGYSATGPEVGAPLGRNGSPVARGTDVDARIARFPHLDLRTPMPMPDADRLYHPGKVQLRRVQPAHGVPALVQRLPAGARWRLRAVARRISPARPARG